MGNIRMVVTDLDGTFLRSDKTISAYTAGVIRKLRQRGILFVAATARPVRAVKEVLPDFPLDGGIYHNGAVVYDGDFQIDGTGIGGAVDLCSRILAECPGCHISAESEDVLYANFDAGTIWPGIDYIPTPDFLELTGKTVDKIILEVSSLEEMETYRPFLSEDQYLLLSENRIAMIMNRKATKANGIRLLAQRHGISLENIVAFGDDYNDIDMLKTCGVGVAMANALEAVKESADAVCSSNDEDGVAHWLADLTSL